MNQDLLRQYAAFAVRVGVNPQKGQTLIITAPIEGAAFVRLCAQEMCIRDRLCGVRP